MSDKTLKETTKTITEKGAFQPKTVAAKELAKKAAKATTIGKVAAAVGMAGVGLQKYLKSKMDEKKEMKEEGSMKSPFIPKKDAMKKSTGGETKLSPKQMKIAGMAGDPNKIEGVDFKKLQSMKANKGVMVKARGCKLGRTKPTKIT